MTRDFTIPGMRLRTQTNNTGHWSNRAREAKAQRFMLACHWLAALGRETLPRPYLVTITRVGPRRCDQSNVVTSAKHVQDQIADCLHIDDGDDEVAWIYKQELGPFAVKVRVCAGRGNP